MIRKVRWQYVFELALIVTLGWNVAQPYATWDPNLRLGGLEAENVTASAYYLSYSIQHLGYLPSWQPFSNEGQPYLDEAYSFILNPFASVPVALYGANNGIKVSIILHHIIVGVGGWFLAQSLGMGMIARILLGALMIIKGNMQGTLGAGFFQLGIAQAYLPWVLAGALAVARRSRERWAPVLLAVSLALLYFCGTIFYLLPAVIIVGFVFVFYVVKLQIEPFRVKLDLDVLRRFVFAGLLTFGIVAVSIITVGLNFSLVWNHLGQDQLPPVDTFTLLYQIINPAMLSSGLFAEFSYSYVIPLWFLALIFLILPPIRVLHRPADPSKDGRLWLVGGVTFALFLAWGISLRPIVPWLYEQSSVIAQWRFPERMLAVATFLLIFLIAFRVDGLNRALIRNFRYKGKRTGYLTKILVAATVLVASGFALKEVYDSYFRWGYLNPEDPDAEECVQWLVANYPNDFIVVQRRDFQTMAPFIRHGVRMSYVGADYYVGGMTPTIYPYSLTMLPAPLYMIAWDNQPEDMLANGYTPVAGSPSIARDDPAYHCVWHNPNAPTYAFSAPLGDLQAAPDPLPIDLLTPVTLLGRTPEHIWLEAQPNPTRVTVVVAQDVAYPGWTVLVDGEPAQLESVGYMLGVQLLPGSAPRRVEFIYTAPTLKLGGVITVVTIFGTIFYLLRGERLIAWWRRRSLSAATPTLAPPGAVTPLPEITPVPVLAAPPVTIAPVPEAQPQTNGHSVEQPPVNGMKHVQIEAETGIQFVLPPSDQPYQVEVIPAPNRNQIMTRVTLAGAVVMLAYLVVSQTRKTKP